MADEKEEYKFPTRAKLKEDWKTDFLDEDAWVRLYNEANDKDGNDWDISQTILNRYFEMYEIPEILRTTGTNVNFDEYFGGIAIETYNQKLSLEKFKANCLKELITLNMAMPAIYRSLPSE